MGTRKRCQSTIKLWQNQCSLQTVRALSTGTSRYGCTVCCLDYTRSNLTPLKPTMRTTLVLSALLFAIVAISLPPTGSAVFSSAAEACDYCENSFRKQGGLQRWSQGDPTDPLADCVCIAYWSGNPGFDIFCSSEPSAVGFVAAKDGGCTCKPRDMEAMGTTTCTPLALKAGGDEAEANAVDTASTATAAATITTNQITSGAQIARTVFGGIIAISFLYFAYVHIVGNFGTPKPATQAETQLAAQAETGETSFI